MEKFVLVVGILHVDKIDQDDAGKVPKAKLSGNFCCCLEVDFAVGLFCFFLTGVLATVDINGNKRLRLLDNKKIIENLLIPFHIPTYLQAKTTHWFLAVSINYMKSGQ